MQDTRGLTEDLPPPVGDSVMHQVKQSLEKLEHLGGNHEDLIEACVCESDCSFVTSMGLEDVSARASKRVQKA